MNLTERFNSKWKYDSSGCWLWTGALKQDGYGMIMCRAYRKTPMLAHRISWELHNGTIPQELQVLHHCDTPSCVNPDHLFLGNPRINKDDSMSKGRHNFGQRNGCAKLNEEQIIEILQSNDSCIRLGKHYGVGRETIRAIRKKIRWKHVRTEVAKSLIN